MIDPSSLQKIRESVERAIAEDRGLLDLLRSDMRLLKTKTRRIQPRSATAISLVGTDGGNNQIQYDPFLVQLIRVVDSNENEYFIDVVTPTTTNKELDERHFAGKGVGKTALGQMMEYFGLTSISGLSGVFARPLEKRNASWVQVYREMVEWAVLFDLVRNKDFGSDTVILFDGFLRSKMFSKGLFGRYREGLEEGIEKQYSQSRRRIYIAGIAKHTKFLQKYRLAMALERVMHVTYPCYIEVDVDIAKKAYIWSESITGGGEGEEFVAGQMYLVKFGKSPRDPVWAMDLLKSQADDAQVVFGYLLSDSIEGFPIPYYPMCLQKAHEHAALVDFDMDIMQSGVYEALRNLLGERGQAIDELALQATDPSMGRYS